MLTDNCIEKTKIKEKEFGNGPFKKTDLSKIAQSGHTDYYIT